MKILFLQWHSFMNEGIENALKKLGVEYDVFHYQFTDWEQDDDFLDKFQTALKKKNYDCAFSVNYAPLITRVCEDMGVKYVSWVYDCPLHIRDERPMNCSCNEIYFFDRSQARYYREKGVPAFHMPLAVDLDVFSKEISSNSFETYGTDVSLIGKLYQTEYQYFVTPLNDYLKGYLEGILNAQMKVYGGYLIPELVSDELLNRMNQEYDKAATDGFRMGRRELEFMLACECTGRERYLALQLLSRRYRVDLYSNNKDERLSEVHYRGYADYYTQMPQIFAASRINLNISLKAIETGIPLRVIDIMGCGGFVLTNFQQELAEYFAIGQDCVAYEDLEDLVEKADYYLQHEEERERIARNGYERVRRDFTFEKRLKEIFHIGK